MTNVTSGNASARGGFNGASFLDFNNNASSLLMGLLAFGAIASYGISLFMVKDLGASEDTASKGRHLEKADRNPDLVNCVVEKQRRIEDGVSPVTEQLEIDQADQRRPSSNCGSDG